MHDFTILKKGYTTVAFNRDTFTDPEWIYHEIKHAPSQITALLIGRATFRRPAGGVEQIAAASLHFHHTPAKKPNVSAECLAHIRNLCEESKVQIIGTDINNAAYNGSADKIFHEFPVAESPTRTLWGPTALDPDHWDCVGFLILPELLNEGWTIRNVGTWQFDHISLFHLRENDKGTHWPCYIHLHQYMTTRADRRSAAAMAKRRQRGLDRQRYRNNTWW